MLLPQLHWGGEAIRVCVLRFFCDTDSGSPWVPSKVETSNIYKLKTQTQVMSLPRIPLTAETSNLFYTQTQTQDRDSGFVSSLSSIDHWTTETSNLFHTPCAAMCCSGVELGFRVVAEIFIDQQKHLRASYRWVTLNPNKQNQWVTLNPNK